jgi:excisionase family DNA binding protein
LLSRKFLTVKDVAELLQVGEVTVRHWIKDGELRAIDVGREWRIAPRDLEQFVERGASLRQPDRQAPRDESRAHPQGQPE